ncbi:ATP-binding protein [Flavobacterium sp. LHD-80]|uniref:tetratricopeptide repeat-containing sensor histidine kinase n=1 Tax=Flavobacterium sp. LHD-80 TaxID=3071411 RepID=UPI0027DF076B|nr:ATP-binding protein [Flavobacterium sp. LHD-80]MDQ6472346.1 ATP-binding protein [Flavobacterium sp. LHD-80]
MVTKRIQFSLSIFLLLLSFFACQKKKNSAEKITNDKDKIEKIIHAADLFYKNKQLDSAFYLYNKARANCNPNEDAKNFVYCTYYMAEIQQDHQDFIGSTITATETFPFLNKTTNSNYIWNIYSVLGRNYYYTYDYQNAIRYYSKAFILKSDRINILEAKNNIAVIYIKLHKFKKALPIFLSICKEELVQENPAYYSKILDYVGFCYYKLQDSRALSFYQKSIEVKSKAKDQDGLGRTYYNLADYYEKDNTTLSMKYAKLSYENYILAGNIDDGLLALKLIINNSSDIETKKNSLIYIKLQDSIYEVRQRAKNKFAKIKYDTKKEKIENLKLKAQKIENELQIEKQEHRNIISYIVILLALGLLTIIYFYLTVRVNRQKIEATYQSETRISKKLHDELANDVYHALAFVENRNLSSDENRNHLLAKLDDIYSRTRNISKENNPILSTQNYTIQLKEMISRFNTSNVNLLLNGLDTISWDKVGKIKKISVYRAIQELLVNMKKHSEASVVAITFKEKDNSIIINYTDNGKGINATKMILKNGLHNMENTIHKMQGEMEINSDLGKGFKVQIKFPL